MPELTDDQLDRLIDNAGPVRRGLTDDQIDALIDGPDKAPQRSAAGGLAHQLLRGFTAGFSDKALSDEGVASNKRYEEEHPWLSMGAQGAGAALSMATPLGWAGRAGAGVRYLTGANDLATAMAKGAGWVTRGRAYGRMGAKQAAEWGLSQAEAPDEADLSKDPTTRLGQQFIHYGKAGIAPAIPGYLLGAGGGLVGEKVINALTSRIAGLGHAATLGNMPRRGAALDIAHEIGNDAPRGQTAADILQGVRDQMYGPRTLGQSGAGLQRGQIPQDAEREMARQFQDITSRGYSDAQARQIMARYWNARTQAADAAMRQGQSHPDAWLLANRGSPAANSTMGGWGQTAGQAYANQNTVPANLTELVALASGGEAPALQTTLRKLLNLKSEGGSRSQMLRDLRTRQGQIGTRLEDTLRRHQGGDLAETIAQHETNARNANSLYPQILQDFAANPNAAGALQDALKGALARVRQAHIGKSNQYSEQVLAAADEFERALKIQGGGMEQEMRANLTRWAKDEATGAKKKIIEVGAAPVERHLPDGTVQTHQIVPTGDVTEIVPINKLDDFIVNRGLLREQADKAYRAGDKTLGRWLGGPSRAEEAQLSRYAAANNGARPPHYMPGLLDEVEQAARGLANHPDKDVAGIFGRWGAANDTRAMAGQLERTYNEGLSLNLQPKRGEALADLERFHSRFRRMDAANQDMARRGVLEQLTSALRGKGDLHDASKLFTNPRAREMLTNIIGQEAADEFGGFVQRAGLATNTFNMNKGSQTASIIDADKQSGWLSNIAGAIFHGNPLRAISHMGEAVGDALKRKKHGDMTDMLAADTRDPRQLERVLEELARVTRPVNRRLEQFGQSGRPWGGAFGASVGQRQQRSDE